MDSNGNGAHPDVPDFERELLDYAGGLRDMLARESAEVERLKMALDEARRRQGRVQKAIDVLTGESSTKSTPSKPKRASSDWHISDAKVDEVWAAIRTRSDLFSRTEVAADLDGISPETVRRAFERLRAIELIRIAGRARGGGDNYAVMPNAHEVESAAEYAA